MSEYEPLSFSKQLISIPIIVLVLIFLCLLYFFKQRKIANNQVPKGYVLIVEIYVNFIRNLLNEILGPKFDKITPFFIFLFSYIGLSNMIGIFGLENPTSSYTVTLSLAIFTFIGVWVIGLKYQRLSFLKNFCFNITTKKGKKIPIFINPLEVIGNISPLISLSFRLWGNITAGSIIICLWFAFTNWIWVKIPIFGTINILGGLTIAPLRAYFDLLSGIIQALVFVMLTMIYWTMAKGEEEIKINKSN